ncbi:hypothetical protein X737_39625 [Mesorhizobium sp. L48C026A00]|nr:hypothetical protein X737_39625 [Mesorhizobium sp. L48C026A00]
MINGYEGIHEPRPGGEIWIVPLQLLLQELVIPLDMFVA